MKKLLRVWGFGPVVVAVGALLVSAPVSAQTSVLDQAKGLLGKIGGAGGGAGGLSSSEIASGLTEAICVGAQNVIGQLGQAGGFADNPEIRVPLPRTLRTAQSVMDKFGFGQYGRDLEDALNRGAEQAVPEAIDVFGDAIKSMTWQDAEGILNGPKDAATQYFKRTSTAPLKERFAPIVYNALSESGAISALDSFMGQYKSLPLVPDAKADLSAHVVQKALNALFLYVGREEAAIRENPAARSTDLLKKVFGPS